MALTDLVPWGRRDRSLAPQTSAAPGLWGGEISPFFRLQDDMNRLFNEMFRDFGLSAGRSTAAWPQIEVKETDDGYRLTAELPGMSDKDVELSLDNGVLTVRGEKKAETGDQSLGYSERYYGAFERRIQVGDVDEAKVNASFDKGVLTIELPRPPEAKAHAKRIPIQGATHH
jgi:HSP20 family protein